jgi:pimeloyl-ACP methyl ester carboxylesterase
MEFERNYIVSGKGRPVVFQHGLGANLEQAQGLLGGLEGIKLISMDCPGHGQSVLPDGYEPSFEAYANDLLRLLDQLKIKKAIFGGISMGSGIALHLAVHHPERVEGLILVRPAWLASGRPRNLEILLELLPFLDLENGKEQFARHDSLQNIQSWLPNAANSVLGMFERDQQATTGQVVSHMVHDMPIPMMLDLEKIAVPCLIIANHEDPLHPYELAEEIAEYFSEAEVQEVVSRYVDDGMHRQEVQDLVRTFLLQF